MDELGPRIAITVVPSRSKLRLPAQPQPPDPASQPRIIHYSCMLHQSLTRDAVHGRMCIILVTVMSL